MGRWLRLVAWALAALPLARGVVRAVTGDLGADPIKTVTDLTGLAAFWCLMATLAVTPVRRLTGWNALARVRRLLGLWTFAYALLHALVYFLFDHQFDLAAIAADVARHPRIAAGFAAFALMVPLAATSTNAMIRRLGGQRWQRLHRLVYVAGLAAAVHFLWLVKRDVREPAVYAAVVVALLAARLVPAGAWPGHRRAPA